jgi:hypothetical protein
MERFVQAREAALAAQGSVERAVVHVQVSELSALAEVSACV